MHSPLDLHDREYLDRLRQSGGDSVQDLCAVFEVTATAVRHRLTRLLETGLVTREAVRREGRGRPRHVYLVTDQGMKQLGNNYGDLARILWRELMTIDDPTVRDPVMGRIRSALVAHYGRLVGEGPLGDRMARLTAVMNDGGYDVELGERDGLPILRENSCPYPDLAACDPNICTLEEEVFSEVLGTPLELTQCWRDGESCCEFEPVTRPESGPAELQLEVVSLK